MSCIYGRRQWGTEDQGWVAHFGRAILAGEPITIFGDGQQVRDILWVDDLVRAMRSALERTDRTAGEIFNVGGGPENAVTVRGVVDRLQAITEIDTNTPPASDRDLVLRGAASSGPGSRPGPCCRVARRS